MFRQRENQTFFKKDDQYTQEKFIKSEDEMYGPD